MPSPYVIYKTSKPFFSANHCQIEHSEKLPVCIRMLRLRKHTRIHARTLIPTELSWSYKFFLFIQAFFFFRLEAKTLLCFFILFSHTFFSARLSPFKRERERHKVLLGRERRRTENFAKKKTHWLFTFEAKIFHPRSIQ